MMLLGFGKLTLETLIENKDWEQILCRLQEEEAQRQQTQHSSTSSGKIGQIYEKLSIRRLSRSFRRTANNDFSSKGEPSQSFFVLEQAYTAVHKACYYNCPLSVLKMLVHRSPKAVATMESSMGLYPLHIACMCGSSLDVLEYLIAAEPSILLKKSNGGRIPLHLSLQCGLPKRVTQTIYIRTINYQNEIESRQQDLNNLKLNANSLKSSLKEDSNYPRPDRVVTFLTDGRPPNKHLRSKSY